MTHCGPTFSKYKKKQKSPLTTGRIPPNLIQSENHTKNSHEKAHCVLWYKTNMQILARRSDVPLANRADHSNSTLELALPYVNECVVDK